MLCIIVLIILLSIYIFHDTIEPYDVKKELEAERSKMQSENNADLSKKDRVIKCVSNATPEDVAEAHVDCCKTQDGSNSAICNHPIFKKCKDIYQKYVNDNTFIKYLGPETTYNNEKKKFRTCANSLYKSFPNYSNVKYTKGKNKTNYSVSKLYPLKNKKKLNELCRDMCNVYKGECVGYQNDDFDCMLYKKIEQYIPKVNVQTTNVLEIVKGNKLFIKS